MEIDEQIALDPSTSVDEMGRLNETDFCGVGTSSPSHLTRKSGEVLVQELEKFLEVGGVQTDYIQLLTLLYGEDPCRQVMEFECPSVLSAQHAQRVFLSLTASLTKTQIAAYYKEWTVGQQEHKILEIAPSFTWYHWLYHSLFDCDAQSFDEFVTFLKNPRGLVTNYCSDFNAYSTNESFLQYTSEVYHLAVSHKKPFVDFSQKELMARIFAYAGPFKENILIPVFNAHLDRIVWYELIEQINHIGIHMYVLSPVHAKNQNLPHQIVFSGTKCAFGLHRDLDQRGVGKKSFITKIEPISAAIESILGQHVEIIGHSLGGADAQRTLLLMGHRNLFQRFSAIDLFCFCAPGVEKEGIKEWQTILRGLKSSHDTDLKMQITYLYHKNDVIANFDHYFDHSIEEKKLQCGVSHFIVDSLSSHLFGRLHHCVPFFLRGDFNEGVDQRTFLHIRLPSQATLEHYQERIKQLHASEAYWTPWFVSWFKTTESYDALVALYNEKKYHKQIIEGRGHSKQSYAFIHSIFHALRAVTSLYPFLSS